MDQEAGTNRHPQPLTVSQEPSILLTLSSIVVIASSLLLIALAIAAFTVVWDPCSLLGGAITLPLPTALALQQYRGSFRRIRSAATATAVMLFGVAAFSGFAFATTLAETLSDGGTLPWFGLLLPMLVSAVLAVSAGWLNWNWRQRLSPTERSTKLQLTRRDVFSAIASVCFLCLATSYFVKMTPPRFAEGVSVAEAPFGLPSDATDVSFCQGYRGTIALEFTTDEDSFRRWVASGIGSIESNASGTKIESITKPKSITRYNRLSAELDGPDSVTVTKGLHYSWSFEDRGVYAIFDSQANRAYYFAHFH